MTVDPENGPNSFKLERLKFILQQIDKLNDRLYSHIALYQTLTTAVLVAGATIFSGWSKFGMSVEAARSVLNGLLGLYVLLAVFVVVFVTAGLIAWWDYRHEETALFDEVVGAGFRARPKFKGIARWHETYLLLLIVVTTSFVYFFTKYEIIPLIK